MAGATPEFRAQSQRRHAEHSAPGSQLRALGYPPPWIQGPGEGKFAHSVRSANKFFAVVFRHRPRCSS
eukprot:15467663-Alexandrium_andersonii.AAC.1